MLVSNWKESYKWFSVWAYAALLLLPDLFNLAVSYDLISTDEIPFLGARLINLVTFLGLAGRLIDQKAKELQQ